MSKSIASDVSEASNLLEEMFHGAVDALDERSNQGISDPSSEIAILYRDFINVPKPYPGKQIGVKQALTFDEKIFLPLGKFLKVGIASRLKCNRRCSE